MPCYRVAVHELDEVTVKRAHTFAGREIAGFLVNTELDLQPAAIMRAVADALEHNTISGAPA